MTADTSHPSSNTVLLSSGFRYATGRLFLGRARLYPDRLILTGIRWTGWHRRIIWLRDLERVSWRTDTRRTANVTLYFHEGAPLPLWVDAAGLWKYRIDERLGQRLRVSGTLPESMTSSSPA